VTLPTYTSPVRTAAVGFVVLLGATGCVPPSSPFVKNLPSSSGAPAVTVQQPVQPPRLQEDLNFEQRAALERLCAQSDRASCDRLANARPLVQTYNPPPFTPAGSTQTPTPASSFAAPSPRSAPDVAAVQEQANVVLGTLVGTNEVGFQAIRADGQLRGCSMLFNVGIRDYAYRNGGVVVVRGGLDILALRPDALAWTVRIAPRDISWNSTSRNYDAAPFSPAHGWIAVSNFSSADRESRQFQCEGGGYCAAGADGIVEASTGAVSAQSLQFGFRRSGGSIDATGRVDLARTPRDLQQQAEFGRCVATLVRGALSATEGTGSPHPDQPSRPNARRT